MIQRWRRFYSPGLILFSFITVVTNVAAARPKARSANDEFRSVVGGINGDLRLYNKNPMSNGDALIDALNSAILNSADLKTTDQISAYAADIRDAFQSHGVELNAPIQILRPYNRVNGKKFINPSDLDENAKGWNVTSYIESYIGCSVPRDLKESGQNLRRILAMVTQLNINLSVSCGKKSALQQIFDDLNQEHNKADKNLIKQFLQKYKEQNNFSHRASAHGPTYTWNVGSNCVEEIKEESAKLTKTFGGAPIEIESKACGQCPDNTRNENLREFQDWVVRHYKPSTTQPMQLYNEFLYLGKSGNCKRHVRIFSTVPIARKAAKAFRARAAPAPLDGSAR